MEFIAVFAIFAVVIVMAAAIAVRSLIVICPPNRVAVVSGRTRGLSDGRSVGYRVIKGGRTIRIPLIEKVDYMDLNTIPIEVSVHNAYSKGAIPLDVQGVANIKVSSREGILENSVERFLGRSADYIQQIAKENLEANLRGVLATLTPEEVNEDRLKFAQTLIDEADDDIRTLGLELDVLKIQNVTDQVGYLEAVGRRRTANVLREARQTEAEQAANAQEAEAQGRQRAELARVRADLVIAEDENKLRVRRAELEAEAQSSEERAEVAADLARVEAQHRLEEQRIELQKRRLAADVLEPAKAKLEAMQLEAQGRAARIIEDGKAEVEVYRRLQEEYASAGPDARDILMLKMLPEIVELITETVNGIDIEKLTVIDSGGAEGGVGGVARQMPAAVISIAEQIETATGINLLEAVAGQTSTDSAGPALEASGTPAHSPNGPEAGQSSTGD